MQHAATINGASKKVRWSWLDAICVSMILLACLRVCLLTDLHAYLLAHVLAYLLAYLLACLCACLLTCLLTYLPAYFLTYLITCLWIVGIPRNAYNSMIVLTFTIGSLCGGGRGRHRLLAFGRDRMLFFDLGTVFYIILGLHKTTITD